jgi:flavin-dependent thymidylate synthase
MMKMTVELIDYTGAGTGNPWYGAAKMIFTKRTRTMMTPAGFAEILAWEPAQMLTELQYMANTVPSSWEFCSYTFNIRDVSRVFTHQLVRTRFGVSFAQQAMQILDMTQGPGWKLHIGPSIKANPKALQLVRDLMDRIDQVYKELVIMGCKIEDAREVLPMGILTNINMEANLRTLCDMMRKRASPRNVSEWDNVLVEMRAAMIKVHPWVTIFIDRTADVVAREMYELAEDYIDDKLIRNNMIKHVDQLLTNIGAGSMGGHEA